MIIRYFCFSFRNDDDGNVEYDPYSVWGGRRKRSLETYENEVDLTELLAGS